MTVMTASVCITLILALPIFAAVIIHRQAVHIGTNTHRMTGAIAFNDRHDSAFDEFSINVGNAPLTQMIANDTHGALRIETMLGVTMQIVTNCRQLIRPLGYAGQETLC